VHTDRIGNTDSSMPDNKVNQYRARVIARHQRAFDTHVRVATTFEEASKVPQWPPNPRLQLAGAGRPGSSPGLIAGGGQRTVEFGRRGHAARSCTARSLGRTSHHSQRPYPGGLRCLERFALSIA
jgi:hypothetical protein